MFYPALMTKWILKQLGFKGLIFTISLSLSLSKIINEGVSGINSTEGIVRDLLGERYPNPAYLIWCFAAVS